jgi:hypothetical protein
MCPDGGYTPCACDRKKYEEWRKKVKSERQKKLKGKS